MNKLAFLFLIYDEIDHERLWHHFFQKGDSSKYSIYIHYKHCKSLKFLDSFKLENPLPTEYADLSLVKAQNLLLREALRDQSNRRFIFVSNSCVPLKPFDYVYRELLAQDCCFFNLAKEEHIFERGRGLTLRARYGIENVKKASQWSILTRDVAKVLAESDRELERVFSPGDRGLSDEYFYISLLFSLKKQHCLSLSDYAATKCATFEYWSDKNYIFDGEFTSEHPHDWDRRLKTYHNISTAELRYLLSEPCFFGRKFAKNCTVDEGESLTDTMAAFFSEFEK